MKFDQFIRPRQGKPLHSNGLVGGVAGSSPVTSFSKRQEVHGRRARVVGKYSDSKLANQHIARESYASSLQNAGTNSGGRIDIVKPTRGGSLHGGGTPRPPQPAPHRFVEPPSRPRPF